MGKIKTVARDVERMVYGERFRGLAIFSAKYHHIAKLWAAKIREAGFQVAVFKMPMEIDGQTADRSVILAPEFQCRSGNVFDELYSSHLRIG